MSLVLGTVKDKCLEPTMRPGEQSWLWRSCMFLLCENGATLTTKSSIYE